MLDESVLKKHTKLSVKDVVAALQELISPETNHHFFYPEDESDTSLDDLRNLNAVSAPSSVKISDTKSSSIIS